MSRLIASALLVAGALGCVGAAFARSSDRNQPMDVAANSTDCSVDANGPCTFSGTVHISQGTLDIRAARIDYDLPADTIVLSGGAFVEQPGQSSIRSERIVYNMRTGQVQSGGEGNGRVKLRLMPKNAAPAPAKTPDND